MMHILGSLTRNGFPRAKIHKPQHEGDTYRETAKHCCQILTTVRCSLHQQQENPVLSQLFNTVRKSQMEIQSRRQHIRPGREVRFCFLSSYPFCETQVQVCPGHSGVKGIDRAHRLTGKTGVTFGSLLARPEVLRSFSH